MSTLKSYTENMEGILEMSPMLQMVSWQAS